MLVTEGMTPAILAILLLLAFMIDWTLNSINIYLYREMYKNTYQQGKQVSLFNIQSKLSQ